MHLVNSGIFNRIHPFFCLILTFSFALPTSAVLAALLEEVVVTAQKRE